MHVCVNAHRYIYGYVYGKLDSLWSSANSIFYCVEYFKNTIRRYSAVFQDTTNSRDHILHSIVVVILVWRLLNRYSKILNGF